MDCRHFEVEPIGSANGLVAGYKRVRSRVTPNAWMSHEGMELPVLLVGAGLGNLVQGNQTREVHRAFQWRFLMLEIMKQRPRKVRKGHINKKP